MDTQVILERLYGVRTRKARQSWPWRVARLVRRARMGWQSWMLRLSQYPLQLSLGSIAVLFWVVSHVYYYNRMVMLEQGVKVEWAQLEAIQQRRNHVQRNLARLLLYYADHETSTMTQLTQLRSGTPISATPGHGHQQGPGQQQAPGHAHAATPSASEAALEVPSLQDMLGRLHVVAEQYPTLHLTQTVQHFSENVVASEAEIASRIMAYNTAVNMYRNMIVSFPGVLFAKLMGFHEYQFYAPEDPAILKYREIKL